jgi:4-hydroxyphenylpyruvate dioxygenase
MRTGIATVCLSGTLREKMQACATAGFDGIEIFEQDLVTSPLSPEDVRKLAADLGLTLDLYQPFRDFDSVPEDLLAANLRRAGAKFKLMSRLGLDTILVCSNVATATIDDDELRASQLARLAALAGDHGMKVAYEALAWGKYVNDYEHAHRLVDMVDHPSLGTCLDSFHILSRDADTAPIEGFDPQKIFFVQVADAPKLSMDVLSWSRHYRVFPGEGQFELAKFMGHVVRAGYTGPVSLEVFNDVFRQSDVERTAVDAMRSLIWLEEQTAKWLGAHPAPAAEVDGPGGSDGSGGAAAAAGRRRYPMELATLPQVAEPAGFNFAEVRSADSAGLETLLGQLGFAFNGRHRTKNVQLWTMGHARVIINEQPPAAADGASGNPGTAVAAAISALGFDVDSPVIAAARAQQLKAPAVPRKSQADEEIFQGFAAPDSTEIFLCQGSPDGTAAWTREFGEGLDVPPAAGTAQGPGAVIDHVNLAQPWQHFDEAVLFYTSALALEPQPYAEVASPTGLVRSQVMLTGDRGVRLVLNLAPLLQQGAGTAGTAATTAAGPASPAGTGQRRTYQEHIAFAVDDLVATARAARDRGLDFLQIPANYYEDLDARFGLDPDFLATLRELNLLYDRDADGEFLHFYTATVGSVFFEMVERRGAYDGYGAPNAPVRHAVQYDHLHQLKLTI